MPVKINQEKHIQKLLNRLIHGIENAIKIPKVRDNTDLLSILKSRLKVLKSAKCQNINKDFTLDFLSDQLEQLGPLLGIGVHEFHIAVAEAALNQNAAPAITMADRVGEQVRAQVNLTPQCYSRDKLVARRDTFREMLENRRFWSGAGQRGKAATTRETVRAEWPAAEERVRNRRGGKASRKETIAEVATACGASVDTVKRYAPKSGRKESDQKGS